jgi:hypothetical protein
VFPKGAEAGVSEMLSETVGAAARQLLQMIFLRLHHSPNYLSQRLFSTQSASSTRDIPVSPTSLCLFAFFHFVLFGIPGA